MELDEFRAAWKEFGKPTTSSTSCGNKPDNMNTMDTISYLNSKTLKAAKWNGALMAILVGIVSVGILLSIILPREATSISDELPSFGFFFLFCVIELWLTERSKSVFLNTEGADLKTAITGIIQRWIRWYWLSNIVMVIFLPALFYIYITFLTDLIGFPVSIAMRIAVGVSLTASSMFLGHMYYKTTYISRIRELKKALHELCQE